MMRYRIKENRKPSFVTEDGKELAVVPIGRKALKEAVLYKADYELLMGLGLSPHWNVIGPRSYVIAFSANSPTNIVNVARVLVDAGIDENVTFEDGNTLNLRRENLTVVDGWADRRDREYLTPQSTKNNEEEV